MTSLSTKYIRVPNLGLAPPVMLMRQLYIYLKGLLLNNIVHIRRYFTLILQSDRLDIL